MRKKTLQGINMLLKLCILAAEVDGYMLLCFS